MADKIKRIPTAKVSELWKREHPRAKQPSIRAYYASKQELNRVADQSQRGQGGFEQNTKSEYGQHNAISSQTHTIKGLNYKSGKTHVVMIHKESTRRTNNYLNHELEHVFHNRR